MGFPLLLGATYSDTSGVADTIEMGFTWISEILNSRNPEEERYQMACAVVRPLGRRSF